MLCVDDRDWMRGDGDFNRRNNRLYLGIRGSLRQQQVPQQNAERVIVPVVVPCCRVVPRYVVMSVVDVSDRLDRNDRREQQYQ